MEWFVILIAFSGLVLGAVIAFKKRSTPKSAKTSELDRKIDKFSRLPLDDRQAVFANLLTGEIFIHESFYGQTLQEIEQTCALEKDSQGCWQYRPHSFVFRYGEQVIVPIKDDQINQNLANNDRDFIKEKFDIQSLEELWVWRPLSSSLSQKLNYHYARFEDLKKSQPFGVAEREEQSKGSA
ncbi:hypothetical protein [Pseudobacteriovorax antillogorgiicola]|uniref:Uncharacterized protein n=1 Tax=Pseudobacteriovorax antillogorgiicola TaxID=1513793 RepID=A0A1Y6BPA1_9BACT|nr:hypothetical protein [Pseudobacteriovorax antillogorgiicola]TCS55529.1 hypothetical protein EDD56_105252 [Pseudobacteriovorax antillogorgiicola]SMF11304.1 hypothetical protein SAMN06296036_10572 [Pseudobacteriovorax antillogorgiicola]